LSIKAGINQAKKQDAPPLKRHKKPATAHPDEPVTHPQPNQRNQMKILSRIGFRVLNAQLPSVSLRGQARTKRSVEEH
jgi:hypothetical protein